MEYSLRFRIYPNIAQSFLIQKTFGSCRFVYNHYLVLRKAAYETAGQALSYVDCAKDLTVLKKQLPWLREADSIALQSSLKDLDIAFQNFSVGVRPERISAILDSSPKSIAVNHIRRSPISRFQDMRYGCRSWAG